MRTRGGHSGRGGAGVRGRRLGAGRGRGAGARGRRRWRTSQRGEHRRRYRGVAAAAAALAQAPHRLVRRQGQAEQLAQRARLRGVPSGGSLRRRARPPPAHCEGREHRRSACLPPRFLQRAGQHFLQLVCHRGAQPVALESPLQLLRAGAACALLLRLLRRAGIQQRHARRRLLQRGARGGGRKSGPRQRHQDNRNKRTQRAAKDGHHRIHVQRQQRGACIDSRWGQ